MNERARFEPLARVIAAPDGRPSAGEPGICHQTGEFPLSPDGALVEGVVIELPNFVEDAGSAQPSQANFPGKFSIQKCGQGASFVKQGLRPIHLMADQIAKSLRYISAREIGLRNFESIAVGLGQVDPVLFQIDRNILPKVGQLQRGADFVGKDVEILAPIAVNQKDKAPNGISAATAVIEDFGEISIPPFNDVLFEGRKKIVEERGGKVELGNCPGQWFEDPRLRWIHGLPGKGLIELGFIPLKGLESRTFLKGWSAFRFAEIIPFIGQIVSHASESINRMDMRTEFFGHEPADGKILVMFPGQARALFVMGINRHEAEKLAGAGTRGQASGEEPKRSLETADGVIIWRMLFGIEVFSNGSRVARFAPVEDCG